MDPGDPADPRVTHGVCPTCQAAARREMESLFSDEQQEKQMEAELIERRLSFHSAPKGVH